MKTIAVIFGGQSTEHDVSVITALTSVIKPLQLTGEYTVLPVYVAKNGNWYTDDALADVTLYSSGKIDSFLKTLQPVAIRLGDGLQLTWTAGLARRQKTVRVDIVFPAMHGTYGEDGSLMGLLRMADIPFVGCDMDAAVLSMDKILAKLIMDAHGIPTSPMQFIEKSSYLQQEATFIDTCETQLTYPMFVKPAHLGSSIGITRATTRQQLQQALEVAFHYDTKVLVEQEIANLTEVTLPIMGNDTPVPALLERPLAQSQDFFDFETKYMQGGKKGGKGAKGAQGYSEIPAKIPDALYDQAIEIGIAAYKALGCQGLARIDMLIDTKTRIVYFNEVNPLPGSLYNHNWRQAGTSNVALVTELVRLAVERHQQRQQQSTVFTTNFLQQF